PGSITERNKRIASSFRSRARDGFASNRCCGRGLVEAAAALPVVVKVAAQLADSPRAQPEPGAHVQRALTDHQVFRQAAVALRTSPKPGGEVQAEDDLLERRRLRVVRQRLLQRVAAWRTDIGQVLDREAVPPLCRPRERVPGAFPPA